MSRWPVELTFRRVSRVLAIRWDDGSEDAVAFETLRVESPSAEVQGHGAHDKKIVTGKQTVGVVRAEPVGRYAVRIVFDDGHNTGLFTWDWLARLAGRAA